MDKIIFHSKYGSIAHGTYVDGVSDIDERIIKLTDNPNFYFNIKENNKQTMIFDVRFFIKKCIQCTPFELEILHSPQYCFIEKLPIELHNLVENYKFTSKHMVQKYLYFANWKLNQFKIIKNYKYIYHSIRMLTEVKNALITGKGPIVRINNDYRDMLLNVKNKNYEFEKCIEIYNDLLGEIQLLPNNLPRQPDVAAIDLALNQMIRRVILQ